VIQISLPYPPSANRLWRAVKGRQIKSAEYRVWLTRAYLACIAAGQGAISGEYEMEIVAVRPDRRLRDIDNLIKPISDAIAAAGLIDNDSRAHSVKAAWSRTEPTKGAGVFVTIKEAA
jgi:crossover junction endodeoxyribonuclease RusA